MEKTKILIGWATMLIAVLTGLAVATEAFAWWSGFPSQLGAPWGVVGGLSVYAPWAVLEWIAAIGSRYGWGHPAVRMGWQALAVGAVVGFLPIAILGGVVKRRLGDPQGTVHGSGRWASRKEIAKAGLFGEEGIAIGKHGGKHLVDSSNTHVMMFAPTRSGKGVGVVIPTLCTWAGSTIVNDIKGENWDITAKYRAEKLGQRCIRFCPTDKNSARYNPLAEIQWDDIRGYDIAEIQKIAEILIDPEGEGDLDYWRSAGATLLVGLLLYSCTKARKEGKAATLGGLLATAAGEGGALSNHERLSYMLGVCEEWEPELAVPIMSVLQEMIAKAEKELSGVWSSATNALSLYRDPVVVAATASSDFKLADLYNYEQPVSLYIVVPPSDLSRLKPLVRLVINQIGKRLAQELENKKKHKVLMLLDEFASLGKLDFFESALAYLAGYGVRCLLITQSLSQLDNAYGRHNSIMANCHIRVCYAPNEEKTARTISRMLGEATVRIGKAKDREDPRALGRTYSDQYVKRFLLTPGEIMQLPPNQEIIFSGDLPPIMAEKIRYYDDPRFRGVWH